MITSEKRIRLKTKLAGNTMTVID